jgi:hypothetical protein
MFICLHVESKRNAFSGNTTRWAIKKSRSPFDKLRSNGIFQGPAALFRVMHSASKWLSESLHHEVESAAV